MRFSLQDINSDDPNSPFWQYMMSRPGWQELLQVVERFQKEAGVVPPENRVDSEEQ